MKSRVLICILFSLLIIPIGSSQTEAQEECRGITEAEMVRVEAGDFVGEYFTPLNELTNESNCVTFTGFPEDVLMLSISVALEDVPGLYDVYLVPGGVDTLSDTFKLTGSGPVSNAFGADIDSFFADSYTIGLVALGNQTFSTHANIFTISDRNELAASRCGATVDICDIAYAGGGTANLKRQLILQCSGTINANVTGEFSPDSQYIQIYRPGDSSPIARSQGRRLSYTVSESESQLAGLWIVEYFATGLRDRDNPVLRIDSPEGQCSANDWTQPQNPDSPGGVEITANNAANVYEVARLTGHSAGVTGVAWSPDGRRAISGSDDQTLILWDTTSGTIIRRFSGHNAPVEAVAYSSDGQTVLSGAADNRMILWDVSTGDIIRIYFGHDALVESVAYSPDGQRLLSGSADGTMILWDRNNGNIIRRFSDHTSVVEGIAYSPDGTRLVSASLDHTAMIWDAENFQRIAHLTMHSDEVESVAFSPDGSKLITSSADQTLILWNAATGEFIRRYFGHTASVESVAFSPNGLLFASSAKDMNVIVWAVDNDRPLKVLQGHSDRIDSVRFNNDGSAIISASVDGTIRIWALEP